MPRYIDADALMDFLTIMPIDLGYREIDDVEEYVKRQPAADVAPVRHGHWEPIDVNRDEFHCSLCVCRIKWGTVTSAKYCPMCGAKMDGGDGDD